MLSKHKNLKVYCRIYSEKSNPKNLEYPFDKKLYTTKQT